MRHRWTWLCLVMSLFAGHTGLAQDDELRLRDQTIELVIVEHYHPKLVITENLLIDKASVTLKSSKCVRLLPGTRITSNAIQGPTPPGGPVPQPVPALSRICIGPPPTGYANQAPVVAAGLDIEVNPSDDGVQLHGSYTDDGLPYPAQTFTVGWTVTAVPTGVDPTKVVFGNAASLDSTVSFPIDGVYTLTLSVSDGDQTGTDEIVVTVLPAQNIFPETGYAGIFTTKPEYHLDIRGTLKAEEVVVQTTGADYVFGKSYKLRPLKDLEAFITTKKHLPGIAPAAVMQQKGMKVNKLVTKQLEKIEELHLYMIGLQKEQHQLEAARAKQSALIRELQERQRKLAQPADQEVTK